MEALRATRATMWRLLVRETARTDRALYALSMVLLAVGTLLSFQLPLLAAEAYANAARSDDVLVAIGVCFSLQHVAVTAARLLHEHIAQDVAMALRQKVFAKLLAMPVAFFDSQGTGDLHAAFWGDVDAVQLSVGHELVLLEGRVLAVLASLVGLLRVSPLFGALILVVMPAVALTLSAVGERFVYPKHLAARAASARVVEVADESLANVRVVKAFAMERFCEARLRVPLLQRLQAERASSRSAQAFEGAIYVFVAALLYAGVSVGRRMLASEQLLAILGFSASLGLALANLSRGAVVVDNGMRCAARVFDLLDQAYLPTHGDALSNGGGGAPRRLERIAFDHLSFAYEGKEDTLRDVCFVLQRGAPVALVGGSGAGKTTVFALLLRFYDAPSPRMIRVDERFLANVPLSEWRKVVGYVPQNPSLFSGSIYDNIAMGVATPEQVERAAATAQVNAFANKLEGGLHAELGPRGGSLSSGQLQRISIARALVRKPQVLLLDEHTAALDNTTETQVMSAIEAAIAGDCITVMICHRLQTAKRCAHIVVLSHGRAVEQGTHAQLVQVPDGHYAKLWSDRNG